MEGSYTFSRCDHHHRHILLAGHQQHFEAVGSNSGSQSASSSGGSSGIISNTFVSLRRTAQFRLLGGGGQRSGEDEQHQVGDNQSPSVIFISLFKYRSANDIYDENRFLLFAPLNIFPIS